MRVDSTVRHIIMECLNPSCRMRFPVIAQDGKGGVCPLCSSPTRPSCGPYGEACVTRNPGDRGKASIEALLDNIRSIHNVGSMFRSSDGAGIAHLYLCGMTPTPDNPRLAKTALGSQGTVPWSYRKNGLILAESLLESGRRLWALEGGARSEPVRNAVRDAAGPPVVLVVGNEISGVDPAILELCDRVFHIPMRGTKTSLNAAVAFGIAAYILCLPDMLGQTSCL